MDRTKTDTIIGIVGAVAIVLTLIGVFAYEYSNAPEDMDGDDGTPTTPPIASESFEGTVASDDTATETLHPATGVSAIQVVISWTPTAPGALEAAAGYTWQLAGPDGAVLQSGSSTTTETIEVTAPEDGTYELTISAPQPSQGGDYEVDATYRY